MLENPHKNASMLEAIKVSATAFVKEPSFNGVFVFFAVLAMHEDVHNVIGGFLSPDVLTPPNSHNMPQADAQVISHMWQGHVSETWSQLISRMWQWHLSERLLDMPVERFHEFAK